MNNPPFDFGLGIVSDSSWSIDESKSLADQLWCYGEDLFHVTYEKSKVTLDVEWNQNGNSKPGKFVVRLIQNCDWERPVMKNSCPTIQGLCETIKTFVAKANELEKQSSSE